MKHVEENKMEYTTCPTCKSFVEKTVKGDGTEHFCCCNETSRLAIALEGLVLVADSTRRSEVEKVRDMRDLAERAYRDLTAQRLRWNGGAGVFAEQLIQKEKMARTAEIQIR